MATASPTGARRAIHPRPRTRRRAGPGPVGHHRGVPIEPFSEFDPFGGEPEPVVRWSGTCWWPRRPSRTPTSGAGSSWCSTTASTAPSGVVIDRPGGVAVDQLLPQWHELATPPAELFTGGPVSRNSLIGLVRLASPGRGRRGCAGLPDGMAAAGRRRAAGGHRRPGRPTRRRSPGRSSGARLFSGYAGWEAGQLDDEIEEGSWYVVPAEARDPVSADPEGLWRRVLRRQGGALALVSGFPSDPTTN